MHRVRPERQDLAKLHCKVTEAVGRLKSLGVFIDASTFDVLDSFAAQMLRIMGNTTKLVVAETVRPTGAMRPTDESEISSTVGKKTTTRAAADTVRLD